MIGELRAKLGLSRQKFGDRYNIPMRTITNWELGITEPPKYVVDMLAKIVGLESLSLNTYVFTEYRRNAKMGSRKMFADEVEAIEYAEDTWNRLSPADQNTYLNDDAIFEVSFMGVEWNEDAMEFEPLEATKAVLVDFLEEK